MKTLFNNIKLWHNNKDYTRLGLFALIIVVILELTLFNCKFYSNMFNEPIAASPVPYGSMKSLGGTKYQLGNGNKGFEILNINEHVKNVYLDMEIVGDNKSSTEKRIKIVISATDEGNANYFQLPERAVSDSVEQTKYIPLNLNGNSDSIDVNFKDCDNKLVEVNKVMVNANVPFQVNVIRIILLWCIIALVYILCPKSGFYKYVFNDKSKKQWAVITSIIILNLAVILTLGLVHPDKNINTVSHHHQYQLLAEALMEGHFYLDEEPADSLVGMENPYDRKERDRIVRDENNENYKWDTAYYNGKYYVYFGVVPALLFFVPTRLMGFMIINKVPVIIMTMLAVIFGYLLIREITRRWFNNTSFLLYTMLSVLFVNSMGIYLMIKVPDLYMIPISSALGFSLMGIYLWIRALPDNEKGKLRGIYLLLGSICMALVAGCRPQMLLASFLAVPLLWDYVFKKRELFSAKSISTTVMFMAPYVVVAAFIMYYNYARFGNIFDFGASYNLTVMDMVSEKFNFGKIPLGLYTYYLQPPYLYGAFPYIRNVEVVRNFMGNYVMEAVYGGMLPCNIILISLFFIGKVKANLKDKKIYMLTIFMIVFGIAITVVDYNTGGIVLRYMVDFMWLIFMACVIVVYAFAEKYSSTPYGKLLYKFIPVGFAWSMIYNFILLFNTGTATYRDNIPGLYYFVESMIEFWT